MPYTLPHDLEALYEDIILFTKVPTDELLARGLWHHGIRDEIAAVKLFAKMASRREDDYRYQLDYIRIRNNITNHLRDFRRRGGPPPLP